MKFNPRVLAVVVLLLIAAAAASAQTVYVSGGPNIYSVNVSTGSAAVIYTNSTANFETLAIGPDSVDTDVAGNGAHSVLLYACDPAGSIIRFDPATPNIVQSVASGLAFPPVCGRSTATGDFYVTNKNGAGVYQLIAHIGNVATPVANVTYNSTAIGATATQIDTYAGMTGRGITQKYIGDLLVVDNSHNQVLHSVYGTQPLFGTLSQLITSNLSGPVGLVNAPSLRQILVSNANISKTVPAVSIFDASGAASTTTCPAGLALPRNSNQTPDYLATAPMAVSSNTAVADAVYLVTNSKSAGTLLATNTAAMQQGNCTLNQVAGFGTPVSGVAVAPTPVTLTLPEIGSSANPAPTPFFFNSNMFQFTAGGCTATVTAYPFSVATVKSLIVQSGNGGPPPTQVPSVNLGDGGFETGYVAYNPQCNSVLSDGGFLMGIANFIDSTQFSNPRVLDCTDSDHTKEPLIVGGGTSCKVSGTVGVYPLGGPIPGDTTTTYSGQRTNFFVVVNETAGAGTSQPGGFCGFQSPLLNPTDPGYPYSFPQGSRNTINVKFKLADLTNGGTCQNGPYLDTATALISVARLSPAFNAVNVQTTANSLDQPPLFNAGNNQYQFTLNVGTLPQGTYSLTVTFLTDNATTQTILFVIT